MDESTPHAATKVCKTCGIEKSAGEFYLQRHKDRPIAKLHPWCKQCCLAYNRKPVLPPMPCAHCGTVFKPKTVTNKWCSRHCFLTWRNRKRGSPGLLLCQPEPEETPDGARLAP